MSNPTEQSKRELEYLTTEYFKSVVIRNTFAQRVNNPICGKPGAGYKTARKLRPQLALWEKIVAAEREKILDWISINRTANYATRAKRLARVLELLPDFDPPPTKPTK